MYYCEKCKKLTQPRESGGMIVLSTRPIDHKVTSKDGKEYVQGHGTAIVKEIHVCRTCFEENERKKLSELSSAQISRRVLSTT